MNIAIVNEDKVILVDGEGLNFDFTLADNIWAVQWNGTTGEIEFSDGTPNQEITDFSDYQYLVDAYNAEKQRVADEEAQAAIDAEAALTYADRRRGAYPSIGDQLDMIYHNGDGGATFQAAIKAIKDKYPKG